MMNPFTDPPPSVIANADQFYAHARESLGHIVTAMCEDMERRRSQGEHDDSVAFVLAWNFVMGKTVMDGLPGTAMVCAAALFELTRQQYAKDIGAQGK
jgi:hypothetical protein